jgi:phospholipase C
MKRRGFLRSLAGLASAPLAPAIARAAALSGTGARGTLQDVQHVLILTQENRSFDQIFGTLRGVRGFADRHAVLLPDGRRVFDQPAGTGILSPFRPALDDLGLAYLPDVDHGWKSSHAAFHGGRYDAWVASKGKAAMQYYAREDIPFHYALADAFTICDAYFCSMMGPTDPNRYYLWSGDAGNDGRDGGPAIDNAEAGYAWTTLPELLARAGVSWRIYQDAGLGLGQEGKWGASEDPFIGNFGDNALLYFDAYRRAESGTSLFDGARRGTLAARGGSLFENLARDVLDNQLPQVGWIVAPEAFSEHPNWPVNFGAWYIAQLLDCLTARPDVWGRTVLFICYDEAGGFFDHVVPPYPAVATQAGASTASTEGEFFPGNSSEGAGPYGLGTRVPMIVVSPWSRGGWVCSEVFDHTSLIRFIERRFGDQHPSLLSESRISPWRRAVCGDLTSAFDFRRHDAGIARLPSVQGYEPRDRHRRDDATLVLRSQALAAGQEEGTRPARALPYRLHAHGGYLDGGDAFGIEFVNSGSAGACFQVRSLGMGNTGPWSYTVEAGKALSARWELDPAGGRFDLRVYGPDGFYRAFAGAGRRSGFRARMRDRSAGAVTLELAHEASDALEVVLEDAYTGNLRRLIIPGGVTVVHNVGIEAGQGWYEFSLSLAGEPPCTWVFAGHVQDGQPGISDPGPRRLRRAAPS